MKKTGIITAVVILMALMIVLASCESRTTGPQQSGRAGSEEMPEQDNLAIYNAALEEGKPVFIKYYTPTCGACKMVQPAISELQEKYGDKVAFVYFNAADPKFEEFAKKGGISAVPTMHYLDSDGTIKKVIVGAQPHERLEEEINLILTKE